MKNNIIIIEGPQGSGKSTMANFLRDNLASSNLYRLTGIKDKTASGLEKNIKMYNDLIDYMQKLEDMGVNLIFDRTFFTEMIYSSLGYKPYDFTKPYNELVKRLASLNYNIYYVVLYLKDTSIYEKRIVRNHHQYQAFSLENSTNQQNKYLEYADKIAEKNINVIKIPTDNFKEAYNYLIETIPCLKEADIKYYGE